MPDGGGGSAGGRGRAVLVGVFLHAAGIVRLVVCCFVIHSLPCVVDSQIAGTMKNTDKVVFIDDEDTSGATL